MIKNLRFNVGNLNMKREIYKVKSITGIRSLTGKTVLCRIDLNVELINGKPDEFSEFKIMRALPTIEWLVRRGARVVLLSHFGRPKGRDLKFSLRPFVNYLGQRLGHRLGFLRDLKTAARIVKTSKAKLFLLENLRFWPGEEADNLKFARELAALGDLYVNEAFAASHRVHASLSAITRFLPSYAGPLLEREVANLSQLLRKSKKPFVVLLGGAKILTKAPVIKNLSKKADYILLGGALAHPFLQAKGYNIGKSFFEKSSTKIAKKLLSKKIILPLDVVVISKQRKSGEVKPVQQVAPDDVIVDIGPATVLQFSEFLKRAQTIVWNGPMGLFEKKQFSHGSMALARLVASRSRGRAFGVVGGGETVAVLVRTDMQEYVDWISTGGGAMLEFLAGKTLPGIKALLIKSLSH